MFRLTFLVCFSIFCAPIFSGTSIAGEKYSIFVLSNDKPIDSMKLGGVENCERDTTKSCPTLTIKRDSIQQPLRIKLPMLGTETWIGLFGVEPTSELVIENAWQKDDLDKRVLDADHKIFGQDEGKLSIELTDLADNSYVIEILSCHTGGRFWIKLKT